MGHTANEENISRTYNLLFKQYYSKLLFYAMRFLEEEEAEDVVQDVFLDLWNRRYTLDMGEYISSFLYKSVYSKSINVIKHKKIVGEHSSMMAEIYAKKTDYYHPDNNDVIRRLESQELFAEIKEGVGELPEKCREVFMLSYVHSLKNKEIAEAMNISLRTVEAHMYKALRLLRVKFKHLLAFIFYILLT